MSSNGFERSDSSLESSLAASEVPSSSLRSSIFLPSGSEAGSASDRPAKRRRKDYGPILQRWHLTWFNPDADERDDLIALFKTHCKKWCFQLELCPSTGTPHYQIRICFKKPQRESAVRKLFPGLRTSPESTRGGDSGKGEFYCLDPDKIAPGDDSGPWSDREVPAYRDPEFDIGSHYLGWQQELKDRLAIQDKRQICIVVDPAGCSGKSVMAHHLVLWHKAIFIPPFCQSGDDIMQFVHGLCESGQQYTILIDLPRAVDLVRYGGKLFAAIEMIKSGALYDKRYRAQRKYIKPPKVVVFCNDVPDARLLTGDRWDILRLPWTPPPAPAETDEEDEGYQDPGLVIDDSPATQALDESVLAACLKATEASTPD